MSSSPKGSLRITPGVDPPGADAILQVVAAPNLAADYTNTTVTPTDIISQSITLTTGTKILAVASAFGKVNSSAMRILDDTLSAVLASEGPQFGIEGVGGTNEAFSLQGHESGLTPGSTHVIKLQAAVDVDNGSNLVSIPAAGNPTHAHASLTLYELP